MCVSVCEYFARSCARGLVSPVVGIRAGRSSRPFQQLTSLSGCNDGAKSIVISVFVIGRRPVVVLGDSQAGGTGLLRRREPGHVRAQDSSISPVLRCDMC